MPGATLGSLRTYLADKLNMDESFLEDMGEVTVKKVYERRPKYSDEVVVTFETKSIRDAVKAQAHNLASYREEAGMRLHIPYHLQKTFQTLMGLSYDLKKRHPDLKWSVKFDDDNWDLFMDVQLGHGQDWKRITAEQANRTATSQETKVKGGRKCPERPGIGRVGRTARRGHRGSIGQVGHREHSAKCLYAG